MGIYKRCVTCKQLFQGAKCPKSATKSSQKRQKDNKLLKLYGSSLWKKCRQNVRLRYFDYDIWLLAIGQEYICKDDLIVHHILERDERPDLLFNIDNLVTVSRASHDEIHIMYKTNKAEAIDRINKGIEEFNARFG